jgi:hypothetical protein
MRQRRTCDTRKCYTPQARLSRFELDEAAADRPDALQAPGESPVAFRHARVIWHLLSVLNGTHVQAPVPQLTVFATRHPPTTFNDEAERQMVVQFG